MTSALTQLSGRQTLPSPEGTVHGVKTAKAGNLCHIAEIQLRMGQQLLGLFHPQCPDVIDNGLPVGMPEHGRKGALMDSHQFSRLSHRQVAVGKMTVDVILGLADQLCHAAAALLGVVLFDFSEDTAETPIQRFQILCCVAPA